MDTFNFFIAMLFIYLTMQYQQNWLTLGIIAIVFLSTRSVTTLIATILGAMIVWYFLRSGNIEAFLPFIVIAFIIIALVLGVGKQEQQPEYYMPGGGMGGMFGAGG